MEALFPDRSATNFYPHTMYSFEKFSEVIVRHKSNNNILTEKSLLQIEDFYKYILEKDMNYENGTTFRFKDICAKRDGECFTTGDAIFQTRIKAGLLEGEATYPLYSTVYLGGLLGSPTVVDNRVKEAKSTKFRFHARNDEGGDQWEQEFRKTMESYQSDEFDFAYAYSKALDDEVNATISGDTILLVFTILLMVSFASSVTMGGNCLSDRSHLGRLGVCTAAIGILGAFGLVCGAGMFFGSISSVAPFLVLGVGLDDMFILLSGLSDTYGHIRTVEDRIGETMRTSGMAITITSLTDLLAFSAGALSSFPAIQSFCTFAAVAIFLTYLMFVTFFLGCMTLYEQRVKSERHCCTCRKIKTKEEMKDNGISGFRLLCCSGSKPNSKDDVQNPIEKVVSNFFSRIVLYEPARFIVLLIFATYLGIGVWGSMYFDEGILLEQLTSVESPFYKHAVWNSELYANSDMTMNFVITKPVPYVNSSTMTEIDRLLEEAVKDDAIPDDFILSWYEAYKGSSYFDDSSEAAFAQNLKLFVEAHPLFLNDVGFSIDGKTVMGSRVYYRTHGVNDIMDFREVMNAISSSTGTVLSFTSPVALTKPVPFSTGNMGRSLGVGAPQNLLCVSTHAFASSQFLPLHSSHRWGLMLYECYSSVDGFIGIYFAKYGRFVARHPWKVIITSILVNLLLGFGLLRIDINTDALYIFSPLNSRASQETEVMESLFPDRSAYNFYIHTMFRFERFSEAVVRYRSDENILTDEGLTLLEEFYDYIIHKNMTFENGTTFSFEDVCAKRNGDCVTTGAALFRRGIRSIVITGRATYPIFITIYMRALLGSPTVVNNRIKGAKAVKFRFHARNDDGGRQWEQEFLKTMESYHSDKLDISYAHSKSLDEEVNATIRGDTTLLVITVLLMISFASSVTAGGNVLSDRSHLGRLGVFTASLGILGGFGLVCGAGMLFVTIDGVAPFLVLGVGLDDMFILLSGLADTYGHITSIEDRIGETMRTSGMAITITSLTDLLAFSVGALSTFPAIRSFCTYTAVAIFATFIMFITFFLACMTLHEQRVKSDRHSLTCKKVETKEEMEAKGMSKLRILLCAGSKPTTRADVQNPIEKYVSDFFVRVVLWEPARFMILLLFTTYIGIGVWGSLYFQEGLLLEQLTSEDSHFYKHAVWNFELYKPEMTMNFVITKPVSYVDPSTMKEMNRLMQEATSGEFIPDDLILSWYQAYRLSSQFDNSSDAAFARNLKRFVEANPLFLNDVSFSEDGNSVVGSRVYYRTSGADTIIDFREVMITLRKLADESPLPVIAFSPIFIYIEQIVAIVPQTVQNLSIALGSIMLVTIFMIPHPVMVLLITMSVASILVGLVGFMHLWGLMLSSITMIEIIMCIGFSVDYSSHIVHAYMQAEGDSRNQKVKLAIQRVGGPVFSGVFSTFVGVLMLLFANSFIYLSFFKVISIVLALGLTHALIIIPVVLTFIGPVQARTSPLTGLGITRSTLVMKTSTSSSELSKSSSELNTDSVVAPYIIPRPKFELQNGLEDKSLSDKETPDRPEEFLYMYY
ncbi:hypothetical protein ScPMuIL_010822 [Solemya velum]